MTNENGLMLKVNDTPFQSNNLAAPKSVEHSQTYR